MSAPAPRAAQKRTSREAREVPRGDLSKCKTCVNKVALLDHLVGDGDQRWWYRQAEHPGGFGVDHQLELRGLHDRQVGRLGTLEDPANVQTHLLPCISIVRPITDQTSDIDMLPLCIDGGYRMVGGQLCQLDTPAIEEGTWTDKERIGPIAHHGGEGRIDVAAGTGIEDLDFQVHRASSRVQISR